LYETDITPVDPIPATNWSVIEANTGIICACLPLFKKYFDRVFRLFRGAGSDNNSHPSRGYNLGSVSSKRETAYGANGRWATVGNKASSSASPRQATESMENIVDLTPELIIKSVNVTISHSDGHSDKLGYFEGLERTYQ
jgi:hypothetical protein